MMLQEQIRRDMKDAMRARQPLRLSVIRDILNRFALWEKENSQSIPDPAAQSILLTMQKQRRDSIQQFTSGSRPDLAAKEQDELVFIQSYLPREASETELRKMLNDAMGIVLIRNVGSLMKLVSATAEQRGITIDKKRASEIAKELLQ